MTANYETLTEAPIEKEHGVAGVLDDVRDFHFRAKPIFDHRDGIPARVGAASPVAEHGDVERTPIAAVEDDEERAVRFVAVGMEEVDRVARMRSVRDAELRAARAGTPIGRGIATPAGDDLGMLGNPGAIVVFGLEVERAQA